ncbi:hypothetical protein [uncultured Aquimarina sp.]|uniref:hypothetical protein n=1 Tax=uncultured Aquimarina sp. TaxID=575652 RepID=UPI0026385172|nr:hypothetical protein [uncultured Aquimarina sp.]
MSAISGMNISMKNNNRRVTREAFSHISGESDEKSQGIKVEPVSEEVLMEIRQKMKQQQKITRIKNVFITIFGLFLVAFVFWAVVSHFQNDPGVSFGPFR